MTNHLPECPTEVVYDITSSPLVMTIYDELHCICDRLRACEQRVWRDADRVVNEMRDTTLDVVREAIAALPYFIPDPDGLMFRGGMSDPAGLQVWLDREAALAAIDALKEKP